MQQFFQAPSNKLIYVFRIADDAHKDCLKVGEASFDPGDVSPIYIKPNADVLNAAARKRIRQYTQTAGISIDLLYTEPTLFLRGSGMGYFNDKEVHQVLLRSGVKRKEFKGVTGQGTEWFLTDLETVKRAIAAVKDGRQSLGTAEVTQGQNPISFRPEQREAIDKTVRQFKRSTKMLWNAKMRFGKTLSALQVVKEMAYERTLILTHRPVVDSGWFDDFKKIFYDSPQYAYGSKNNGETFESLEALHAKKQTRYVYFASMQDLRGSEQVGGKFLKNSKIFSTPWDLIIVDEAHEGTQTELGKAVTDELVKEETRELRLSGTPFNLLDDFKEDEIYTWDYVMEQRAKENWDSTHFGDPNPYAGLPKLNIFTYNLGRLMGRYADAEYAFNFREFFRTDNEGNFVHKADVKNFLDLLSREDDESMYPFATKEYRNIFRHTLWMVPGVRAAKALSAMLRHHPVFGFYDVVNVAGDGDRDEERGDALRLVENAIGPDPDQTLTITLSCGRLTTGVSVKPWTGVLMLSGNYNTAASAYMQTIFRVQTPATINGRVKEQCYVFDFAPDRTLQVLATVPRVSTKTGKTTESQKQALGEFLNFCPVIAIEGSTMQTLNVNHMLQQLKRAYVERVVRNGFEDSALYNDELLKLTDVELEDFDNLKGIIGSTKASPKTGNIDINNQGLTNEEYEEKEELEKKKKKELTPEEKARLEQLRKANKNKENAISILRGISIRMPLIIYGADITDEDAELTIDNFTRLVDPASWEEFMPHGVTTEVFNNFKRYYDPEIFAAAGKRIRSLARAADGLSIEERISRLASIFQTFRNPDKETVLTPWRVVCMHMGDTLGGFCFFDEDYRQMTEVPRFIDRGRVTAEVFAAGSRVLELNSKSGLYPLYLTYNIYRARMGQEFFGPTSLQQHQLMWDRVVAENIFVVCRTPMAQSITRRTLLGFRPGKVNTLVPRKFDLIEQIKTQPELFIKNIHHFVGNNMKISAIVGNPPYQIMDGGAQASASPVYNKFVDAARAVGPLYLSMIMPTRWYAGGKGLDEFRESMLADAHISKIFDFLSPDSIFPSTNIRGGICYFLWDSSYDNQKNNVKVVSHQLDGTTQEMERPMRVPGIDIFIRDARCVSIIQKVEGKGELSMEDYISVRRPFGLSGFFVSDEKFRPSDSGLTKPVVCYGKGKKVGYVEFEEIPSHKDWVDSCKVFIPRANNIGTELSDDNLNGFVGTSGTICTESYLVVGGGRGLSEAECQNICAYFKTRFARYMHSLAKASQDATSKTFKFVPLQTFTPGSDIDWGAGVAEIDRQLYQKYGLTEEEVAFVERMIKPM